MLKRLPIISSAVTYKEMLKAMRRAAGDDAVSAFGELLTLSTRSRHLFPTNSGISSFYIILEALKGLSDKKEVILPAYTAGSLITAVKKAALKPVLGDISLDDFNIDDDLLTRALSPRTLAVVGVHLFGINMKGIMSLRSKIPSDIFLIEDCAQSMGSRTFDKESGSFADAGFFSFNRGKNLPIGSGGAIITSDERISAGVEKEILRLENESPYAAAQNLLKAIAFSMIRNPVLYGLTMPLANCFKETLPPKDFTVKKMSNFAAALGIHLMPGRESLFMARHRNGIALINGLKDTEGVVLPKIPENTRYVFNRLPVLLKDINLVSVVEKKLSLRGIETSRMYIRPLHRMFDLGYGPSDFPNAIYLADRLLTLPTHPLVTDRDADIMISSVKEALR